MPMKGKKRARQLSELEEDAMFWSRQLMSGSGSIVPKKGKKRSRQLNELVEDALFWSRNLMSGSGSVLLKKGKKRSRQLYHSAQSPQKFQNNVYTYLWWPRAHDICSNEGLGNLLLIFCNRFIDLNVLY